MREIRDENGTRREGIREMRIRREGWERVGEVWGGRRAGGVRHEHRRI